MKTFKETLDERNLRDYIRGLTAKEYQTLKDAYYGAVENIRSAEELLGKLDEFPRISAFTKEHNIFAQLAKIVDKSALGKIL